ncbi:MAG: hypothetical protein IT458_17330 [Planctomycetes bacterium]|nr:hypothetical protein [Planctomycetota bacterium]
MRTLLSLCVLGSTLAAQGLVTPAHFAVTEGNTLIQTPLGVTQTPSRFLQVHDDMSGTARTINALAFRRDGNSTTAYGAYAVIVDISLSTSPLNSATASLTFDSNHGGDRASVAFQKVVQLPATTHSSSRSFVYKIPFNQPFSFAGGGPLVWDVTVTSRTNSGGVNFDAFTSASTNPPAVDWSFGTGCKATTYASAMTMTGGSTALWSSGAVNLSFSGSNFPKSAVVTLMLGGDDKNFGGLPLPWEIPGTNGFPSGVCRLYVAPLLTINQITNASGAMSAILSIGGMTQANNGNILFTQAVAIDANNAFGLVFSNLVQHQIVAPFTSRPISYVYRSGSTGATGTVARNQGLVTSLE